MLSKVTAIKSYFKAKDHFSRAFLGRQPFFKNVLMLNVFDVFNVENTDSDGCHGDLVL